MTEVKNWWKSVGIWGGLTALLPAFYDVIVEQTGASLPKSTELIDTVAPILGGIIAIIGRIRATAIIK